MPHFVFRKECDAEIHRMKSDLGTKIVRKPNEKDKSAKLKHSSPFGFLVLLLASNLAAWLPLKWSQVRVGRSFEASSFRGRDGEEWFQNFKWRALDTESLVFKAFGAEL